jgi:demethylmenaquinone methyltransferase/2-methoxy-6-polyprenyl-1,4-benzoquinol methylase
VGFKQAYFFYFNFLVPVLGYLVSGVKGPYSYLPASLKNFPHQKEISNIFRGVGLTGVAYYELTGGIVTVHVGTVPDQSSVVSRQ